VVGVSASPEFDDVVFVSAVKSAFGVAALTLDPRSFDQGIGWSSGEPRYGGPG
jgi:hypothetical protein